MIVQCDLHIHSCLSPCADQDMTPGNIVSMAKLKGLQVIAVTDHQTCGNCAAVMSMAEKLDGPLVLPGLEVESQEEIHLVCLFPELEAALAFAAEIRQNLPERSNRIDIFGEQTLCGEDDDAIGCEELLLLQACNLNCDEIVGKTTALGGVCIPAHIDRESNSILTVLGRIPQGFPVSAFEISGRADESALLLKHPELAGCQFIRSSDAHRLADIAEPGWPLDVSSFPTGNAGRRNVLKALRL